MCVVFVFVFVVTVGIVVIVVGTVVMIVIVLGGAVVLCCVGVLLCCVVLVCVLRPPTHTHRCKGGGASLKNTDNTMVEGVGSGG